MRPRCLIDLVNHCRGYAVNLRHSKIDETDIEKGLQAYSMDLIRAIELEIEDVYEHGGEVLYSFIGCSQRLTAEQLSQILDQAGAPPDKKSEIIDALFWFGFLGFVWEDGDVKYIYSYHYETKLFKAAAAKAQMKGLNYQINEAFWSGLGITS
jgi:hypothetical protein